MGRAHALAVKAWLALAAGVASGVMGAGTLALAPTCGPPVGPFWPAAGLLLAVALRLGWAALAVAVLGLGVAFWAQGHPPALAAWIAVGAGLAYGVAAMALRHTGFSTYLERRRDIWSLLLAGGLGAPVLAAGLGCLGMALLGPLRSVDLPLQAGRWWWSESLGALVAGTPLICLGRRSLAQSWRSGRRPRTVALLLATAASLAVGLAWPPSAWLVALGVLMAPVLLLSWLAMRSGLAVAASAVWVSAMALWIGTARGLGPLAAVPPQAVDLAQPPLLLALMVSLLWATVVLSHAQVGNLARLEERWQRALEGSDLGVADWDTRTNTHFSSARWRALTADPDGEQTATLARWLALVHPDDLDGLQAALGPVKTVPGTGLRCEVRLRLRDAWCWFDVHLIVAERDAQGRPVRVVASLSDIGARRQAEERQRLWANVFQHLHEGLVVTDANLRIVDANPTYCRIAGHPREALIGTVPGPLQAHVGMTPTQRQQQALLWASLRDQGHWVGEVTDRRPDGLPGTLQLTVSSVRAPDNALRYHVLVVSDLTEQRQQQERLARQAHFDELTRLPNRARLVQLMAEAMAATDRDGCLLAVCSLDLDGFKAINETHGHEVGNALLAEVARRLRSALRTRGHSWADAAARLGGDEFVLLLRAGTVDEARAAVERVLRVVSQPFLLQSDALPELITASIGATIYPLDGSDADTLLRHADHSMYGVKQSGRNGYLFFDPEHNRRHQERVMALGRLQEALDRDELLLHFQPKVDLRRGVVKGVEALLRWQHPERGLLQPAQFLPLIENTGLSASVGDQVLAQALSQLAVWQSQGLDLSVSVNISARHLQEPDFAQRLAELLARHAAPLGPRLELEVLETAALADVDYTSALMSRCATLGVRWALDDFGTGYSTLTYLKRLPLQVLKIDRSFVQHMLVDEQDRAIVEGVVGLARTFDCTAVAEGIETPAQARMLLDMGCELGQGMGIAPPMPAAEVGPWVREWRGLFALSAAASAPPAEAAGPAGPAASSPTSAERRGEADR